MTLIAVNKVSKWIMVLFLLPVILGTFLIIRTHFALLHAVAATGTITELIAERNNDGKTYYHPVLLFTDLKGETHKTCSSRFLSPGEAKIGDKCDFLYDPEDFSTVEDLKFIGIILIGFGLLDFFFFLIVMLVTKKMLRSASKNNILQSHIMFIPTNAQGWNRFAKLMMLIPCLVIIIGAAFAVRTIIFLQDAVPATGTISELIEEKSPDSGTNYYFSVFAFQDAKGVTHKIRSSLGNITPAKVGDKIEILYNPKNPDMAEENDYYCRWGLPMGCFRQGAVALFILWLVAIITKRRMASAAKTQQQ